MDLSNLQPHEINKLVAETFFGWREVTPRHQPWRTSGRVTLEGYLASVPSPREEKDIVPAYTHNLLEVWPLLKRFADFQIESENQVSGQWRVFLDVTRNNGTTYPVSATVDRFEDIPLAICRAALIAHDLQGRLKNDEVIPGINP